MIDRINLILRAKNITARQFAEEIGIQPSGMSHILGGRNNPSLDFALKVLRRYPEIDANWLLLGKGQMYATAISEEGLSQNAATDSKKDTDINCSTESTPFPYEENPPDLFSQQMLSEPSPSVLMTTVQQVELDESPSAAVSTPPAYNAIDEADNDTPEAVNPGRQLPSAASKPARQAAGNAPLQRIVFFYADSTFSDYLPAGSGK